MKRGSQRSLRMRKRERMEDFIPIYVVMGFLDAGKTSFFNTLFRRRRAQGARLCCIQFERGEEELEPLSEGEMDVLRFSIRELQSDSEAVSQKIYEYLVCHQPDQIWVEWNGMLPFSHLLSLFPRASRKICGTIGDFCKIKKIIYMADASKLEQLINGTGGVVLDQLANCDLVVLRSYGKAVRYKRMKHMLRELIPGIKVLPLKPLRNVEHQLGRKSSGSSLAFLLGTFYFAAAYLLLRVGMGLRGGSPDVVVNVFLGTMLQAAPFLLIGVLLSSAIQVFVSQQWIERWFPKNWVGGILFAVFAGFCLPVCDCASIPVFRSLVRKGVPMVSAVTFMAATPVINPVVILSTWYAFNGNYRIVLCRVGLGILCAAIIGLTFVGNDNSIAGDTGGFLGTSCACGCIGGTLPTGVKGKVLTYLRHAQVDFFTSGKYLMMGAFVSALFQTLSKGMIWARSGSGLLIPLLMMMVMAFFLSLCSSSDAVVARSFASQFPTGVLMGFLVFGPMMDVKNVIMLSGSFSRSFLIRLGLTTFFTCAFVVYLMFSLGLERMLR